MRPLKGLIFDLDGTLIDSAPDLGQAVNLTLQAHGLRPLTLDELKPMLGDGMLPMLSRAFTLAGGRISDQVAYARFQEFITHYRTLPPSRDQLYPHAHETLLAMKERGIALGLCTNKQEASTLRLLEGLQIRNLFDAIAGGDTYPIHKPHPDHVRMVANEMLIEPRDCVMIGDSSNDVLAAKGAGLHALVITHGYANDCRDLPADGFIDSFTELDAALTKLGYRVDSSPQAGR